MTEPQIKHFARIYEIENMKAAENCLNLLQLLPKLYSENLRAGFQKFCKRLDSSDLVVIETLKAFIDAQLGITDVNRRNKVALSTKAFWDFIFAPGPIGAPLLRGFVRIFGK